MNKFDIKTVISGRITKDTLNQLKLDYKEDFEIESITYTKENDSYVLFVHPKSEPDISFRVIKWAMGGNNLIDDYLDTRRYLQTKKHFKPFAESISNKYLIITFVYQLIVTKFSLETSFYITTLVKTYRRLFNCLMFYN